jgi:hypothetical protein
MIIVMITVIAEALLDNGWKDREGSPRSTFLQKVSYASNLCQTVITSRKKMGRKDPQCRCNHCVEQAGYLVTSSESYSLFSFSFLVLSYLHFVGGFFPPLEMTLRSSLPSQVTKGILGTLSLQVMVLVQELKFPVQWHRNNSDLGKVRLLPGLLLLASSPLFLLISPFLPTSSI